MVVVGKTGLALQWYWNPRVSESPWLGGGDVESQVRGTQESGESPWFGGLDGEDQGSPKVAEYVRACMLLGELW